MEQFNGSKGQIMSICEQFNGLRDQIMEMHNQVSECQDVDNGIWESFIDQCAKLWLDRHNK